MPTETRSSTSLGSARRPRQTARTIGPWRHHNRLGRRPHRDRRRTVSRSLASGKPARVPSSNKPMDLAQCRPPPGATPHGDSPRGPRRVRPIKVCRHPTGSHTRRAQNPEILRRRAWTVRTPLSRRMKGSGLKNRGSTTSPTRYGLRNRVPGQVRVFAKTAAGHTYRELNLKPTPPLRGPDLESGYSFCHIRGIGNTLQGYSKALVSRQFTMLFLTNVRCRGIGVISTVLLPNCCRISLVGW